MVLSMMIDEVVLYTILQKISGHFREKSQCALVLQEA